MRLPPVRVELAVRLTPVRVAQTSIIVSSPARSLLDTKVKYNSIVKRKTLF